MLFKRENTLIEEVSPIKTKIKHNNKHKKARIICQDETSEIQIEKSKQIRPKQYIYGGG